MKRNRLWFTSKKYGWGWTPVTWQGWIVTGVFLAYEIFLSVFIGDSFEGRAGVTSFFFLSFLGVVPLIFICLVKGEKPRFRWGK